MALRRFPPTNRKAESGQSSLGNDRTSAPTYASNVMTPPYHTLPGRDSVRQLDETIGKSSLTDTLGVAEKSRVTTPNYIYYRIYAEDGAIPSKTPFAPVGDPFLGRIKVRSVPPPRTAKTVKRSIAKAENIKDRDSTTLFLTPYSQSPMDDAEKFTILNGTGPGSTPQEPLALVAKMSDSERSALESEGRSGIASAAEPDTAPPEIQYLYYLLYADDYEMPSKVPIDPEEPSLGRIRADSVAPPHSPTSIKRCISRVERKPALVYADLFADTSCDTPLNEGHILTLRTDDLGLSPNEPMAIVQVENHDRRYVIKNRAGQGRSPNEPIPVAIVQVKNASVAIQGGKYLINHRAEGPSGPMSIVLVNNPLIPDGMYQFLIKNRAKDVYWGANKRIGKVYFYSTSMEYAKWNITHDTNGNISMTLYYPERSLSAPSLWVGAKITGSIVPVPCKLIPASGGKSSYLDTFTDCVIRNPRVPGAKEGQIFITARGPLNWKDGGQQMWEFIPI